MRWKTQSLIAGALTLAWAGPAQACDFWYNVTFLNIPEKLAVGVGAQIWTGNDADSKIYTGDVSIRAGNRVVVRPAVGLCKYGDQSDFVYGGGIGVNLWNDATGKVAVNLQSGVEIDSYDGGTFRNIPLGAAVSIKATEQASVFGGFALQLWNDDQDGESISDTDQSAFGGVTFNAGKAMITVGGSYWKFKYSDAPSENFFLINVGASMEVGSGMNALRSLGSLFRK